MDAAAGTAKGGNVILEGIIVCIMLVFSTAYFVQQLRWVNEQKERIKRWEELINDEQTGDKDG